MKLEDITAAISKIDTKLSRINEERDRLNEQAKTLAAEKAKLEYAFKVASEAPPSVRAHMLGALGIASTEQVNGG